MAKNSKGMQSTAKRMAMHCQAKPITAKPSVMMPSKDKKNKAEHSKMHQSMA